MRGYRLLLTVNAAAMAAAGLMLILSPNVLAGLTGVRLSEGGVILSHLLGASEFAFATLCLFGIRTVDRQSIQMVSGACIVLHAASAVALLTAWLTGANMVVLLDVAFRLVMIGFFAWLGLCSRQPSRPGNMASGRGEA